MPRCNSKVDAALLASQFRPEFLNRIDEVIRFRPLEVPDLVRIVQLQLKELKLLVGRAGLVVGGWGWLSLMPWPVRAMNRSTGQGPCVGCCGARWKIRSGHPAA